jgi:hypothetical protein
MFALRTLILFAISGFLVFYLVTRLYSVRPRLRLRDPRARYPATLAQIA